MNIKKAMKGAVGAVLSVAIAASSLTSLAYKNSTNIDGQWANAMVEYGTGDPFIMKYNGMYYLYPSTLDGGRGMYVFSSPDMVNWKAEGQCGPTDDEVITTAYAPEVTYWNGTFYMYTAPGGGDHRVLTAKSPLGPFKRVGNRLHNYDGNGIDGSVYIDTDENASKYFYRASGDCIRYDHLSDDMLSATGGIPIPGANVIGHWTEGPGVFKRNGKYYMTYTGNHVQSDNYMIKYSIGDTPVDMKQPNENILLINTEEGITGLGHNSTVVGPDLDSRYIVYHNLISNTNSPERRLNIDRLVFNGEKMEVQGPTWWEMDNPKMPDFYDRMENGNNWDGGNTVAGGKMTVTNRALSKSKTTADYTAEFNFTVNDAAAGAKAGVIVSYTDDNNYAYAYITPDDNKINLDVVTNGKTVTKSAKLPPEYTNVGNALRKLTVKTEGGTIDLYVDDRLLVTAETTLSAGKIGMKAEGCTLKAEYTAFSSTVNGNEDKLSIKPTGSAMDAVHANSVSRAFETGAIQDGSDANITSNYAKDVKANDSLTFKINPQETSNYSAEILANAAQGTTVSLSVDGKKVAENVALSSIGKFATDVVRNIKIDEQAEEITLTVEKGSMDFYSLKLAKQADIYKATETQDEIEFERLEGCWTETADTLSSINSNVWSKTAYGSEYWGDYEISADVNHKSGSDAGILFRIKYANDASDKEQGIGGCDNGDYHYAYYAFLNSDGVHLGKQMFNWKELANSPKAIAKNKYYNLKVRAEGANIKVYLDGALVIDYTDTSYPIMAGRVGTRVHMGTAAYQNYTLTHLNPAEPVHEQVKLNENATPIDKHTFKIYSNAYNKGYELKNGGIDFNNGLGESRITKGLANEKFIDGTLSCDLQLPGTGGFQTGLLLRLQESKLGNNKDNIDGVAVQLERGGNGGIELRVYHWQNRKYSGQLASKSIANYFVNKQGKTARLSTEVKADTLTVYLDGEKQVTADISAYPGAIDRQGVGFRALHTAHVILTNYTIEADPLPIYRDKLDAAIAAAEKVDAKLYTDETVKVFQDALDAARAIDESSTQEQIDKAASDLNAAINGLKKIEVIPDPKPEPDPKPDPKPEPKPEPQPQPVKPVNVQRPKAVKKFTAKKKGKKVTFTIKRASKKYKTYIEYRLGKKKYKKLALTAKTKFTTKKLKKGKYTFRAYSYIKVNRKAYKSKKYKTVKVTIK